LTVGLGDLRGLIQFGVGCRLEPKAISFPIPSLFRKRLQIVCVTAYTETFLLSVVKIRWDLIVSLCLKA